MSIPRKRATALAASLALTALLTGCSSGGDDASTMSGSESANLASSGAAPSPQYAMPSADAPAAAMEEAAPAKAAKTSAAAKAGPAPSSAQIAAGAGKGAGGKLSVPESALTGREIIYTAEQTIEVAEVSRAVSAIEAAVDAAGGLIAKSERNDAEPASANLRMRIPPGAFDSFLERIGKVGLVLERTITGNDVTDEVVDVRSRVDTARKSAARVRALMGQAGTLRDVVALESELAQRESDLESLLARQAKLKNSTELATVTVHLVTKAKPAPPVADDEPTKGFVTGLGGGWDAFTASAVGIATVLGAVLPFAILLLVLAPVLLLLNRRYQLVSRLRTTAGDVD